MTFYSAKFNVTYDFPNQLDTQELLILQSDCETLEEFEAILKAEEVFDSEPHSDYQLPLLQS